MKALMILMIAAFLALSGAAQNKGQEKKERAKGNVGKGKEERRIGLEEGETKEEELKEDASGQKNKGNAYGKNKGELSGREFGMQRSKEARERFVQRYTESNRKNANVAQVLSDLETKLQTAKANLEKRKKTGTLSGDALKEKEDRIQKAEKKISALREKLKLTKEMLNRESEKEMD